MTVLGGGGRFLMGEVPLYCTTTNEEKRTFISDQSVLVSFPRVASELVFFSHQGSLQDPDPASESRTGPPQRASALQGYLAHKKTPPP